MKSALNLSWKGDPGVVKTVGQNIFLDITHPRNKTLNKILHLSMLRVSHL